MWEDSSAAAFAITAYGVEWWVFAVILLVLWWRLLRQELHGEDRETRGEQVTAPACREAPRFRVPAPQVTAHVDDAEDPEMAAYNRYLHGAARQGRRRRGIGMSDAQTGAAAGVSAHRAGRRPALGAGGAAALPGDRVRRRRRADHPDLIGVPLQVWGDSDAIVKIVGPLHGALYVIYLLLTLDLARRVRMNVVVMLLVMAAGTIPFLSFVAERKVTAMVMGPQRQA